MRKILKSKHVIYILFFELAILFSLIFFASDELVVYLNSFIESIPIEFKEFDIVAEGSPNKGRVVASLSLSTYFAAITALLTLFSDFDASKVRAVYSTKTPLSKFIYFSALLLIPLTSLLPLHENSHYSQSISNLVRNSKPFLFIFNFSLIVAHYSCWLIAMHLLIDAFKRRKGS